MITPTAISTRAAGGISSAPPSSDDSYTASPSSSPARRQRPRLYRVKLRARRSPVTTQSTQGKSMPNRTWLRPNSVRPLSGRPWRHRSGRAVPASSACGRASGRRVRRPQLAIMLRWPTRWAAKALIRGGEAALGTYRARARRGGCILSTVRASAGWGGCGDGALSAATAVWRASPRNRDGGTRRPRRRE